MRPQVLCVLDEIHLNQKQIYRIKELKHKFQIYGQVNYPNH